MGFLALRKHNVILRNVYAKKPESYCAHVLDIFGKRVHVLIRFRWSSVDGHNAAKNVLRTLVWIETCHASPRNRTRGNETTSLYKRPCFQQQQPEHHSCSDRCIHLKDTVFEGALS